MTLFFTFCSLLSFPNLNLNSLLSIQTTYKGIQFTVIHLTLCYILLYKHVVIFAWDLIFILLGKSLCMNKINRT